MKELKKQRIREIINLLTMLRLVLKKKIYFLTKPIVEIITKSMSIYLTQEQQQKEAEGTPIKLVYIVYGGDHGEGKL